MSFPMVNAPFTAAQVKNMNEYPHTEFVAKRDGLYLNDVKYATSCARYIADGLWREEQ